MLAYLDWVSAGEPRRYPLGEAAVVLGRQPDCDLVLPGDAVSRRHARLEPEADGYVVYDLGSRNGTFVNGQRVQGRQALVDGDLIGVCGCDLRFHQARATALSLALVDEPDTASMHLATLDATLGPQAAGMDQGAALAAVLAITRELGSGFDLEHLLPRLLHAVLAVCPQAEHGAILLLDPQGVLVPMAVHGRSGETAEVRLSRAVLERALTRKEAILSRRTATDLRFAGSESLFNAGVESLLCVPLLGRASQPLGVIEVRSAAGRPPFSSEHLELVRSLAAVAAIAVENARLHDGLLAQDRLRRDLERAREVQRSFLTSRLPEVPEYRFFVHWEAAQTVGGDYYGLHALPGGRVALAIGDVSGKGLPAALLMARLSADVRLALAMSQEPAEVLRLVNRSLAEAAIEDRFITFVLAVLDPERHTLRVANAGHSPPLLRHHDGTIEPLTGRAGVPLNISDRPELQPETLEVTLAPGACVVVWTDGLSEAVDPHGEPFGDQRIQAVLAAAADPAEVGTAMIEEVRAWSGGGRPKDDTTLIAVGRVP